MWNRGLSLASFLWDIRKLCRPRADDYAASDRGLHCLLTESSNKFEQKRKIPLNIPKIGNGLVLLIRVGKFIRLKWVKYLKLHVTFDLLIFEIMFLFFKNTVKN